MAESQGLWEILLPSHTPHFEEVHGDQGSRSSGIEEGFFFSSWWNEFLQNFSPSPRGWVARYRFVIRVFVKRRGKIEIPLPSAAFLLTVLCTKNRVLFS